MLLPDILNFIAIKTTWDAGVKEVTCMLDLHCVASRQLNLVVFQVERLHMHETIYQGKLRP